MNIQVQICGLLILVLVYIFYKTHRTLKLYRERLFFQVLCTLILSLVFDIVSVMAIYYRASLPESAVKIVCRTYIASLICVAYSPFMYILSDIIEEKRHKRITCVMSVATLLLSMVPFLLPIHIFDEGGMVYTYGPAVFYVYAVCITYIITTLVTVGIYRKKLNSRRRFATILWMVIWIISAAIQFLDNRLLVVGFASVIGVLILFVIIENPEANLDRKSDCFNSYALTEYLKELLQNKEKFAVLDISISNRINLEEHSIYGNEIISSILRLVRSDKDVFAFKNTTYGLILISENVDKLRERAKDILNHFVEDEEFAKQTRFILTTEGATFSNMDELLQFLSFARSECVNDQVGIFDAGENIVSKYHEQYEIQQEITEALIDDRVEVFLQPIYSNTAKRFTSAEALVRIRRTDGTLLPPGLFIPIAEDSGQILALGERVMEKVCEFLGSCEGKESKLHYIEVNLSVIQCENKHLADRLISIVEKYGIHPNMINLEITETASISARNTLHENMKKLIDYGFTFSLDDFGKGESNLMYVVEMPVSIVKLDYDLSKAFFTSPKARHVVRAVIGMAHEMGLKLVSEGIETIDENDSMKEEGIDYIQGYYYSKPLPMKDFVEFIREY